VQVSVILSIGQNRWLHLSSDSRQTNDRVLYSTTYY